MSQTPYAPPTARVSDPPEAQLPRPASVSRAVACLWLSAALTLASTALQLVGGAAGAELAQAAATGVITALVLALVAAKVGARRRWARWLFVVLYLVGSPLFVVSLILAPQIFLSLPVLLQISGGAQFALQTTALVLLFTRASRQWFS